MVYLNSLDSIGNNFYFEIRAAKLMESLRSIKVQSQVYNISKHDSTPLMPIRSDALKNLSKSSQATMNIAQMNVANNDARSIIEKLMHSGNPPLLHRGSSSTGRDVLLDAEEKIFQ